MAGLLKHFASAAARPFHTSGRGREEAQARTAATSRTLYIGNLAFVTTDAQVHALFSRCGAIERVIMGLNRVTKMPCGFCFVMCVASLRANRAEGARQLRGAFS